MTLLFIAFLALAIFYCVSSLHIAFNISKHLSPSPSNCQSQWPYQIPPQKHRPGHERPKKDNRACPDPCFPYYNLIMDIPIWIYVWSSTNIWQNSSPPKTNPNVRFTHLCLKRVHCVLFVFSHPYFSKLIIYLNFLYITCLHVTLRIRMFTLFQPFFTKKRQLPKPKTYTILKCSFT